MAEYVSLTRVRQILWNAMDDSRIKYHRKRRMIISYYGYIPTRYKSNLGILRNARDHASMRYDEFKAWAGPEGVPYL